MRAVSISRSLVAYLSHLEYSDAALAADPNTEHLAPLYRQELSAWDAIFAKERSSRRDVTRSDAVVAVRNLQLDISTMHFGTAVRAEDLKDPKIALFRRFFRGDSPSMLIRRALRKQCEYTINMVLPELEKLTHIPALGAYFAPLKDGATAALAALDSRSTAHANRSMVATEVLEWKEGINAMRLSTYGELLKIGADKGFTKAWAESFFRSESSGSKADDESDVDEPSQPLSPAE